MRAEQLINELDDKYRTLAMLGEGGTARVWLAMARGPSGFSKLVVLKSIRRELFDAPDVVPMFLEEARLAARLNHPNIVQTNEVFELAGQPVIVMEYLDGLPFSVVLERQREGNALALAMLLRIVSDSLAGLHAAHELRDYDGTDLQVVHRDVSPHNLFVTFTGQVKVLDFGIAQLSSSKETTESGIMKGKLRYMAPEQIAAETRVDRRADIYAMGVVLWEVAAARRMWAGVPEGQIRRRSLSADLPQIRQIAPDVDEALAVIIERSLSALPGDRYATAQDFASDLDEYVSTLGAPLRNADLGRALSKMFDDVRQERRQTIESQLAHHDALPELGLRKGPVPELTSFSNVRAAPVMRRVGERLRVPGLIAATCLVLGLFLLGFFWPDPDQATQAEPPTESLAATTLAPAEAQEAEPPTKAHHKVHLRVVAFPRSSKIHLDGELLSGNPHQGTYEWDPGVAHVLRVEAPGYAVEERSLLFERDTELVLNLRPLSTKPAPAVAHAKPPSAKVPPESEEPTEVKPRCTPPYYYDERGIKKFRPECL